MDFIIKVRSMPLKIRIGKLKIRAGWFFLDVSIIFGLNSKVEFKKADLC